MTLDAASWLEPDPAALAAWRAETHRKLDELIDCYEAGAPLWIKSSVQFYWPDTVAVQIDLVLREAHP